MAPEETERKIRFPPFFAPCGLYSSENFQELDTKKTVLTPYLTRERHKVLSGTQPMAPDEKSIADTLKVESYRFRKKYGSVCKLGPSVTY